MSDIAIRVENLSKMYHIGKAQQRHDTVRDALAEGLRSSTRWLRRSSTANRQSPTSDEDLWALKDVSFEVKRGEVLGIIGRNGAGKSTLLKILSRITEPTAGRVVGHGRVGALLEVGTGFHPELTGRENIYLNGAILGMKRTEIEHKFDEIVAFAEVEKFLDTPVKRYSSGMYVRLAFAVAAHLEPDIMIIDEVLAVGDAAFQKKCLGKMGDVAKEGRTVLFVSHNMAAVKKLCPSSLLLNDGQVVSQDMTPLVIETYTQVSKQSNPDTSPFGVDKAVLEHQNGAKIVIDDIDLLRPDGEVLERLTSNDSLLIRIHYTASSPIIAPGFIVMVESHDGIELFRVSNMPISGYYISQIAGAGSIDLVLEKIPLTGGRYLISLGLARANVEWLLRLDAVAWFEIEPTDAYGSGLAMDNQRGFLILPHHWNHAAW